MKRAVFTVLALLATVPSAAAAQGTMTEEPLWGPSARITPFVGVAPSVGRTERWTVSYNGAVSGGEYDVDLGAGPAVGAAFEIQMARRFALIGAGYFVTRGDTREYSQVAGEYITSEGSDFAMGKIALAVRLREAMSEMQLRLLTATVFAGPAYIREMPSDQGISDALGESLSHWAANFGVDAEIPLGDGAIAIQLGVEDFLTFWNSDAIADRYDAFFGELGLSTESTLETDVSNMIIVRAGLSFRFR